MRPDKEFSLDFVLDNYPELINFPEDTKKIFDKKRNFAPIISLSADESVEFLRLMPLLQSKRFLEQLLFQGEKDKLSQDDLEKIEEWERRYEQRKTDYQFEIPNPQIFNSPLIGCTHDMIKRLQDLNHDCVSFQKIRRDHLAVDVGIGGTFYIFEGALNNPSTYAKLVPLHIDGKRILSLDSMECYDAGIQSVNQWEEGNLLPNFLGIYTGTIQFAKLFGFEGVIMRSPEAAEFSQGLGVRQIKVKKKKLSEIKIGLNTTEKKHYKDLYRDLSSKNRFVGGSCFSVPNITSLSETIGNLKGGEKTLNPVQEMYVSTCSQILHYLQGRN